MKFNNRNIFISESAKIGQRVRIGDNTTIYDNVTVGDDSVICNDVVLGEPTFSYYDDPEYENPETVIGENSLIRSQTVIYAGCRIGPHFSTGHGVIIRENSRIGEHCAIGTMSDIQHEVVIGDYCKLNSHVTLSQRSKLGNFVFMYPFTVMTNDPTPPSDDHRPGSIGDYSQVSTHSVILPGMKIGENCLIGVSSVVTKNIPDYSFAIGDPAKVMCDIRKFVVMHKGRPYPWMKRFSRGMPWDGVGYTEWLQRQTKAP